MIQKCTHTVTVKREKIDFYTEGKISKFRVLETWTEEVVCANTTYDILNEHPFDIDSGLDPLAKYVRCKKCGQPYYLFPVKTPEEDART